LKGTEAIPKNKPAGERRWKFACAANSDSGVAVGQAAEECDVIRIFQDQNRSQKSISEFEQPSDAVRHAHVDEKVGLESDTAVVENILVK
jgi:hypothetical protein